MWRCIVCPDAFCPGGSGVARSLSCVSRRFNKVLQSDDPRWDDPSEEDADEVAREIGAVNTVIRRGDRLCGYNTDALGFEAAIKEGIKDIQAPPAPPEEARTK